MRTGTWQAPKIADVVNVVKSEPIILEDPNPTSRVIFLERGKVPLTPGRDRAVDGISSVLISGKNAPVTTSGFTGSTKTWGQIRTCVKTMFKPFAVQITDVRPTDTDNFAMVIVGGTAKEIGVNDSKIGGLAPFSSAVIGRPIVFAFSTALRNNVRTVCETIAMEVAHAYGLDHSFLCKDVMTYLSGCGAKSFVDKNLRCGEKKARDCQNGQPTQNSFQHLLKILGPATYACKQHPIRNANAAKHRRQHEAKVAGAQRTPLSKHRPQRLAQVSFIQIIMVGVIRDHRQTQRGRQRVAQGNQFFAGVQWNDFLNKHRGARASE